jgi:HAD superfamily hydrolase (TIGR01509 family)
MVVKAVIFDYGGTLVQMKKPWDQVKPKVVSAAYRVLRQAGLKLTFEQYRPINDTVFQRISELEDKENRDIPDLIAYQEIVGRLFPLRSKMWRREVAARANDASWASPTMCLGLRRGVKPTLKKLRALGLKMAVLSNHHNPHALLEHLNELGIDSYFSKVVISAETGLRKPDPRFFEICFKRMRVRPGEAVLVGDSLKYDIEGAKKAGLRTILVTEEPLPDRKGPSMASPDFVISDILEVPGIISSIIR